MKSETKRLIKVLLFYLAVILLVASMLGVFTATVKCILFVSTCLLGIYIVIHSVLIAEHYVNTGQLTLRKKK